MAEEINLAPFRLIKQTGPTKFCSGKCQCHVPLDDFYKSGGKMCKKCKTEFENNKKKERAAERNMYF